MSETTSDPATRAAHDLAERARQFASAAHRDVGQLRKYSGQPYEVHLQRVAEMVAAVTDDPEMIAAAWLHDVVEDTPTTIEDIDRLFGPGVRELVDALTDVSRPHDGNRAARKALDRAHLARAPARAQTVKLADLIDNCNDICSHNPRFGRVFVEEMAALLGVLTAGDDTLQKRASKTLERWRPRVLRAGEPDEGPLPRLLPHQRRAIDLFTKAFHAQDVAEPRSDAGLVGSPAAGDVGPNARMSDRAPTATVASTQVVDTDAGLVEVVAVLSRHDVCYVRRDGLIVGHVGRRHMQGPVARMWLFGIVTSIEVAITERIRSLCDEGRFADLLTPARLDKARALQQSRAALGRAAPLLDCLQLADKVRILLAVDDTPRALLQGQSKAESQRLVRDLEDLRNSLAHAQDIVTHDWTQIVRLARRLHELAQDDTAAPAAVRD